MLNGKKFADAEICGTFFKKFLGLMFRTKLKNKCLFFMSGKESIVDSSIHMFFVFFPIDVAWLDKDFKVVDIRLNLKPFSLVASPKRPAKYIIEAKAGRLNSLRIGDLFELKRKI